MSFELSPLAKQIFLKGYDAPMQQKTDTTQQMPLFGMDLYSSQMPQFGMNFTSFQMPSLNYSLQFDSINNMFSSMQNMMTQYAAAIQQIMSNINDITSKAQATPDADSSTPAAANTPVSDSSNKRGYNHKYSNISVTTKYTGTAEELNEHLKGKGLLEGKGEKLLELQEKYGINAAFLAAIARAESGGFSSTNNLTGITNPGGKSFRKFNSVDECLEFTAKMLKEDYIGRNLTTIAQIHEKYCPIGANNDPDNKNPNWGYVVGSCMTEMTA